MPFYYQPYSTQHTAHSTQYTNKNTIHPNKNNKKYIMAPQDVVKAYRVQCNWCHRAGGHVKYRKDGYYNIGDCESCRKGRFRPFGETLYDIDPTFLVSNQQIYFSPRLR